MPYVLLFPKLLNMELTKIEQNFVKNCYIMRTFIRKEIEKRKRGETSGGLAVEGNKDIITMLLEDKSYTNPQDIIDDIIVMFIAGSKTVQGTTTNFLSQYVNNENLRKGFHAEVDPLLEKVSGNFVKDFTYEMTEDLVYVKNAYNEVMRIDTPFSVGSPATVT